MEPKRLRVSPRILASALLLSTALSGCGSEAPSAPPVQPMASVGVATLHPKAVAVSAELPGRVSASLLAEVRPQVGGIIRARLFSEGGDVKAGDILFEIEPAPYRAALDGALAEQSKAEAGLRNAQAKASRQSELVRSNTVSQQAADDAENLLAQARADAAAAAARVAAARIDLANTSVKAPIDGRVDRSEITPGALVTANQATPLTVIRRLDPVNVDVTQSSTNLLRLRQAVSEGRMKLAGEDVSVRLKLETGADYDRVGRIEFAEANIDRTTGTFTVRAEFPNPDRLLLPGMFVRAVVREGVAEGSFLVPQRAVGRNQKGEATGRFVGQDGKVQERVLGVGRSVGSNWLVERGISPGDRIIIEGGQLVRPGQTVTATEVTVDEASGEVRPSTTRAAMNDASNTKN